MNLTQKILNAHLVSGTPAAGEEVSIRIDQTLTQDSTGTMAYLQFEAMGIGRVKTRRSVAYIDHNTLQTGFENADDHQYIQSVAKKHGIWCSKPGNGICHQVNVERFGVPANNFTGFLAMVAFFFMQVFYALGPGLCVWLVLSELMPRRIRANGMAIALFMNQLVAWGLASWFRPWVAAWGWSSMFFFFAANGVLYFITVCFIPETKGKSLEELEHLFDKKLRA